MLWEEEGHSPIGLVLPRCCCRQIPFVIQASIQTLHGAPHVCKAEPESPGGTCEREKPVSVSQGWRDQTLAT